MNVGIWGWDTPNSAWVKVLVDSDGHLKVDVLTSLLPTGAATLAKQTDQLTKLNSIITKLAGGLPAALDTLALKVREQGTPTVRCTGWDGTAWQTLLVEDDTDFNLRVKLFDGATGIGSELLSVAALANTLRGLVVNAACRLSYGAEVSWRPWRTASGMTDASTGAYVGGVAISGWNGTRWDRLRVYGTGILKVGRAEIGATLSRETAVGSVAAGARKLWWITIKPSGANWLLALTDDTAGAGTVIWDEGGALQEPCHCIFDPPIEFATGIYIETFTNLTSVAFSYT